MASVRRDSPLMNATAGELEAQRIACSYLVKGCERALFDFGLIAGETANAEAAQIDKRAVDIMRYVVGSWRDTLSLLAGDSRSRSAEYGYEIEAAILEQRIRGRSGETASL